MNINWYPGHMAKAKRMIKENLKLIDIVLEVRDARIPHSSANPDFEELYGSKGRIVLLNKKDLADNSLNNQWINYFNDRKVECALVNSTNKRDIKSLNKLLLKKSDEIRDSYKKRKGIYKTVRAMVIGIPNSGKSTLINTLSGNVKAKAGDRPGVTKGKQWVKIGPYLELLDTPGLLWPKLDNIESSLRLCYVNSIKEEILDIEEIALAFINDIKKLAPDRFEMRYKLQSLDKDAHIILEEVCKNRGWLMSGGIADTRRGARQILDDFQTGRIGRITLEKP